MPQQHLLRKKRSQKRCTRIATASIRSYAKPCRLRYGYRREISFTLSRVFNDDTEDNQDASVFLQLNAQEMLEVFNGDNIFVEKVVQSLVVILQNMQTQQY